MFFIAALTSLQIISMKKKKVRKKRQILLRTVKSLRFLWEAEVGGSWGQEIQTIQVNKVKPRLY